MSDFPPHICSWWFLYIIFFYPVTLFLKTSKPLQLERGFPLSPIAPSVFALRYILNPFPFCILSKGFTELPSWAWSPAVSATQSASSTGCPTIPGWKGFLYSEIKQCFLSYKVYILNKIKHFKFLTCSFMWCAHPVFALYFVWFVSLFIYTFANFY